MVLSYNKNAFVRRYDLASKIIWHYGFSFFARACHISDMFFPLYNQMYIGSVMIF